MRAAFFRSPMRTIGLLGGMSWESTATYYRLLNEEAARRRGGLCPAPILLASVDVDGIAALQGESPPEEGDRRLRIRP